MNRAEKQKAAMQRSVEKRIGDQPGTRVVFGTAGPHPLLGFLLSLAVFSALGFAAARSFGPAGFMVVWALSFGNGWAMTRNRYYVLVLGAEEIVFCQASARGQIRTVLGTSPNPGPLGPLTALWTKLPVTKPIWVSAIFRDEIAAIDALSAPAHVDGPSARWQDETGRLVGHEAVNTRPPLDPSGY